MTNQKTKKQPVKSQGQVVPNPARNMLFDSAPPKKLATKKKKS